MFLKWKSNSEKLVVYKPKFCWLFYTCFSQKCLLGRSWRKMRFALEYFSNFAKGASCTPRHLNLFTNDKWFIALFIASQNLLSLCSIEEHFDLWSCQVCNEWTGTAPDLSSDFNAYILFLFFSLIWSPPKKMVKFEKQDKKDLWPRPILFVWIS